MPRRPVTYMEEKRAEIVTATVRCLVQRGVMGTSLSDICAAAGISRGALYVHFNSKDEILEAVVEQMAAEGLRRFELASARGLRAALFDHIGFLAGGDHKDAARVEFELILSSAASDRLRERLASAAARRRKLFRTLLERARRDGRVRNDVDLDAAAAALHALSEGITAAYVIGAAPSVRSQRSAVDFVLGAIFVSESVQI